MIFARYTAMALTLFIPGTSPQTEGAVKSALRAFTIATARCTGSAGCRACSSCEYCGHCAGGGGSCGVCSSSSSSYPLSSNSYTSPSYTAPARSRYSSRTYTPATPRHYSSPQSTSMAMTTADQINVRRGPGTNYPVIATISSSQFVTVSRRSGAWAKVSFSDFEFTNSHNFRNKEVSGWVDARYLQRI